MVGLRSLFVLAVFGGGQSLAFFDPEVPAGTGTTVDLLAFTECMDGPTSPIPGGCTTSNFRPDAAIDLLDFAIVQRGYLLTPGPIQFATETAGEINPVDQVDEYTFPGVFGATVTVDFATPSVNGRPDLVVRLDLVRPNGSVASTTASCGNTARLDTIPLDATGTWKVSVRAYESFANCGFGADNDLRIGVYTLAICPSNAPALQIDYGQTRSNVFSAECQIINYSFAGLLADVVSIMYLGPANVRQVRLYAPNGSLLAAAGGGMGTAITDVLLPLDGTYRIAVEAADAQPPRAFSIGLSELGDATPIALSTTTPGALQLPAEADTYSFEGVFGTTVTVDYATPSITGRPDLAARIDLLRPNGSVAATTATCGTNARLDSIPIDFTGTWRVRVRAYESWFNCGFGADTQLIIGTYSLIVCPSNAAPIAMAYGQTQPGNFMVDCAIVNYQFTGAVGDVASVMYLGPAVARWVRLYAPNGILLATSGGGQGAVINDIALPLNGLYRIAVEASDNQPGGAFSVGLSKLGNATPIAMATATPGELALIAEADMYSFSATFGSTVTVDFATPSVESRPDIASRLELIRPNGTTAATTASCGTNARLDSVLVDATGTWTVRLRAYESWYNCGFGADQNILAGDYTLAMCTSDSPPTAIAYGQTRNGSFNVDCQVVNYEFTGTGGDSATLMYFGSAVARRLQLFGPNGAMLATSGGGQGTSLNDIVLPASGTYRIAVEAADNQPVGPFSIGLSRLGTSTSLPLDASTMGTLTAIGDSDLFSFTGVFGTRVNADYSTVVLGLPDIVARLDLIRPNGSVATSTATCGGNARLDSVVLDATGEWKLRVRPYESWFNCGFGPNTDLLTGSYIVAVSASNSPATAIAYTQTRNGNLLVDSQMVNFQFIGSLGDLATVVSYGPGVIRRLLLFAPNGALLATSAGGTGAAILDAPLPLNGSYQLTVEAADNQPVGAFSVGLTELGDAASISVGVATGGTINQIGEIRQYSFTRTSGEVVSIQYVTALASGKPDVAVRLDLLRPNGSLATSTASCSGTATLNNVSIDQSGIWTLRVRPYESWANCGFGPDLSLLTGAFNVRVCAAASCP